MHLSKAIIFILLALALAGLTACTGPAPAPNTGPNPANTNAVKTNSGNVNSEFNTAVKTPEPTTNAAESIAPVILAYYTALKTKDDNSLRKLYTAAAIKELEVGMKGEGKKSIAEYITDSEPVGDKPFEVRNEKIQGDTAIAEIKGGSYDTWIKWKFIKEGGSWKKAPPSEDLKLLGK